MSILDLGPTLISDDGHPFPSPLAKKLSPEDIQTLTRSGSSGPQQLITQQPPNIPTPNIPAPIQQQGNLSNILPQAPQQAQAPQGNNPHIAPSDIYRDIESQAPRRDDPKFQQHGLAKLGNIIASLGVGPFAPLVYNAIKQVPFRRAQEDWGNRLAAIKPEMGFEEAQMRERGEEGRSARTLAETSRLRSVEEGNLQRNIAKNLADEKEKIAASEETRRKDEEIKRHNEALEAERVKAAKEPSRDDKYISLLQKQALGQVLTPEENSYLKAYKNYIDTTKIQPGVARMEILGQTRGVSMIDTKNNNRPTELNWDQINQFNQTDPGRFLPAGTTVPALKQEALIGDIRGNIEQVDKALNKLPEDFGALDRAKIAFALRSNDPKGAMNQLMSSGAISNLSPEQQEYIITITNLVENALSMRTLLGVGQGSRDLRAAIEAVIPGPTTPNKSYAKKQLQYFAKTLERLEKGIPGVPLRGEKSKGKILKIEED